MDDAARTSRRRARAGAALAALVAVASAGLLVSESPWIAGPEYFRWPYDGLAALPFWLGFAVAIGPIGWVVARTGRHEPGWIDALALCLGAAALAALAQGLRTDGAVLDRATWILEEPQIHGYLSTARQMCPDAGWLADFPARSAEQSVHVRVHPPGLVGVYCGLFAMVGSGAAVAPVAAGLMWILAALAPLVTFRLGLALGLSRRASILGASALALSAAPAAFAPSFDAVWPTLVAALYLSWRHALRRGHVGAAILTGLLAFAASLASYVLGLAAVAVLIVCLAETRADGGTRRAAKVSLVAIASVVASYVLAYAGWGFDPFAVFAQALDNQAENTARWFADRAWPTTIGWDLLDFGRGLSWPLVVPLGLAAAAGLERRRPEDLTLVALALLLPLGAALSGQVTTETFRTWMFMLPPALLLVGQELASWPLAERALALLAAALVTGAVLQQEIFIWA